MKMIRKIIKMLAVVMLLQLAVSANATTKEQYLQNAKKYYRDGKYRETTIELKNAIKEDPEYVDARLLLGEVNLVTGQPLAAEKEYLQAKKAGARAALWVIPLGDVYLKMGRYDEIMQQLKLGADSSPEELSSLSVLRGMALSSLNKNEKAKEEFNRALQLNSVNAKAYLGLASIAMNSGDLKEAESLIIKAVDVEPKLLDVHLAMTGIKLKQGDIKGAISSIEKARGISSINVRVLLASAEIYLSSGNIDKAEEDVDKALEKYPSLPIANHIKSMVLFAKRDFEASKNSANKVLRVSKDNLAAIKILGAIAIINKEYFSAQEHLQKAHSLAPKDTRVMKGLAEAQYKSGDFIKAKLSLKKVLDITPDDAAAISMLGSVYLKLGETEKGKKYMEKAVEMDPTAASHKTNLALANIIIGDNKSAIAALEQISADETSVKSDALLAITLAKDKEFGRAFEIANKLIDREPQSSGGYTLRGEINLMAKNNEAAAADFAKAVEINPENLKAILNLARTNAILGKHDLAEKLFKDVLQKKKDDLQAMFGLVGVAQLNKDSDELQKWLEKINELYPTHIASASMLTNMYAQKKDFLKSIAVSRKLYKEYPRNIDVLVMFANQLLLKGEYKRAADYYENGVKLDPENGKLYFLLARAVSGAGDNSKALTILDKGLENDSGNMDLYKGKARLLQVEKQHDKALKLAKQIIKKWPDDAFGYDFAADIYAEKKDLKRSIEFYEKTIEKLDNPETRIKLHRVLSLSGDNKASVDILREWYIKNNMDMKLNAVLALTLQKQGNGGEAIGVYETMIRQQPQNIVALNNLSWLYMEKGDLKKAEENAKSAYEVNPELAAVLDTYGWILVKIGKLEEGDKLIQDAIRIAPQDRDIRYHVAAVLAQKGDNESAIIEVKQALDGKEEFQSKAEAQKLLEQLQK